MSGIRRVITCWAVLACAAAGTAEALPRPGGGAEPAPVSQGEVRLGAYCESGEGPARSADGGVAYCVQVKYTDAFVWSSTPEKVATDPHFPPSPGDSCLDADDVTVGSEGRTLYCNPTVNGRHAGNLVWQLLP
ncbi:hypothetical protein [Nocardia asteroides]|uniref:hypothetical protein n=1 Tax=Nocardia asteroides TaxID=1824 RepID=UPI0033FEB3D5